jgi:hypothetical protein
LFAVDGSGAEAFIHDFVIRVVPELIFKTITYGREGVDDPTVLKCTVGIPCSVPPLDTSLMEYQHEQPKGGAIRFALKGSPPGFLFDPTNGLVQGVPLNATGPDGLNCSLYAVDGSGAEAFIHSFTVHVESLFVFETIKYGRAGAGPITTLDCTVGTPCSIASFDANQMEYQHEQPKGGEIRFLLKGSPPGFLFDPTNGLVQGVPLNATGSDGLNCTLFAVDGSGAEAFIHSFNVRVVPAFVFETTEEWKEVRRLEDPIQRIEIGLPHYEEFKGPHDLLLLSQREADRNPSETVFSAHIDQSLVSYKLGASASGCPDLVVNANTGALLVKATNDFACNVSIFATYLGNDIEIRTLKFEPFRRELFETKSSWDPATMMLENIREIYPVDDTFVHIPGPDIPRKELFTEPHGNDYDKINYKLHFFRQESGSPPTIIECKNDGTDGSGSGNGNGSEYRNGSIGRSNVTSNDGDYDFDSTTDASNYELCPDFYVSPDGSVLIKFANKFKATAQLVAVDGDGQEAIVKEFNFSVKHRDVDVPTNGPNDKGCAHGDVVDDDNIFDGQFTCDCSETKYKGDNCETGIGASGDDGKDSPIVGAVLGTILALAVVLILGFKYQAHKASLKAFDFKAKLENMLETGDLKDDQVRDNMVPREIKRSCVQMIAEVGAGAFGEVWKGALDESMNDGGVPEYQVAIKTSHEPDGEGADDLLQEALVMHGARFLTELHTRTPARLK